MNECDRCGKKIRYGTLCEFCEGYLKGYVNGQEAGIEFARKEAEREEDDGK